MRRGVSVFVAMRWLMICLFVSVVGLLLAAAGVARHIWLKHRELNARADGLGRAPIGAGRDLVEEIDVEPET